MSDGTPAYDPADLQTFFQAVSDRLAALEQWAAAVSANGLGPGGPPGGPETADEARQQARAIVAEAERQAEVILEEARMEGRALVEAVRDSLNDALRLRDQEVLAAVGESHSRVLALLGEQLRKAEPA